MSSRFVWTARKMQALQMDWNGQTAAQIAATLGVTVRTVEGWRRRAAWRARRQQVEDAAWRYGPMPRRAKDESIQ